MLRPWTTQPKVMVVVVVPFIILTLYCSSIRLASPPIPRCHLKPHHSLPVLYFKNSKDGDFIHVWHIFLWRWRLLSSRFVDLFSHHFKKTGLPSYSQVRLFGTQGPLRTIPDICHFLTQTGFFVSHSSWLLLNSFIGLFGLNLMTRVMVARV